MNGVFSGGGDMDHEQLVVDKNVSSGDVKNIDNSCSTCEEETLSKEILDLNRPNQHEINDISLIAIEEEQNRETTNIVEEMVASWGIVKVDEYLSRGNSRIQFWKEGFTRNVLSAINAKYMTPAGGFALLGLKKLQNRSYRSQRKKVKGVYFPSMVKAMIDTWGVLRLTQYKEIGGNWKQFWKESFVRNVVCTVKRKFLSIKGGALMLGVSSDQLSRRVGNRGSVKVIIVEAGLNNNEEAEKKEDDLELRHVSWWEKIGATMLRRPAPMNLIDVKKSSMRHWILFLKFSQLVIVSKKDKFNPYKASTQEVAEYLQFLQLSYSWTVVDSPGKVLASLAKYLPSLAELGVVELMTSHQPSLILANVSKSIDSSVASPFTTTWECFVRFCQQFEFEQKDMLAQVDPFLAEPDLVREFILSEFQGVEMRVKDQQETSLFRTSFNFYTDNLSRIAFELDWHLQFSWLTGPLKQSKEMAELVTAAISCDERLLTDDLGLKLSPKHTYSKFRINNPNLSEDRFWERQFTQNVMEDVKSKALPASVAASGLGVTAEMVYWAIKKDEIDEHENMSVSDYVFMGFGSKFKFWKESSIVHQLNDVRERKIEVEEVAAQFGVSRREIADRCGGVKTEAEIEAEKTLAEIKKINNKAEQELISKKKKTQLELQIEIAERIFDSLSEYEKTRLNNMRERQALVESLDFDKEKREIRALTPKNQPRKVEAVQLREKSARVKRRSQLEQLKQGQDTELSKNMWMFIQEERVSPKWFGLWVPRTNKVNGFKRRFVSDININDVYDEEAIKYSNHIPRFDLCAPQLLEKTSRYHKSRNMLESLAAECKYAKVEKKLITNPDWRKFELVQDSVVSSSSLSSLGSCGDLVCYGTDSGGVGIFLAGRSVTLRPHNKTVVRTLFTGRAGQVSGGIISAGLDGMVRMTDLTKMTVCIEYSWDQSYSGKQGVNWLEERGMFSFLLDCVGEVNQIDIRSREAVSLFQLSGEQTMPYNNTSLSVHPVNKNLICLSRKQSVQIRDLRKADHPVLTVPSPPGSHLAGAGWNVSGSYLVTSLQNDMDSTSVPVFYPGSDLSQPLLTWDKPGQSTTTGISWCPWQESMFLTTLEQPKFTVKGGCEPKPRKSLVAVDCSSGHVIGELSSGLDYYNYLVHCHKSRQVVVVGNNKGPGGLAVFSVSD